ncbi:hypothetical protein Nit79A3_1323 [Nitrosomonas sp. Is79A3]|uniref:hypothetical protein n=1 Tax=Nitrosomonas sp. (strain Is79A3) TaxID=261292 RepID=UPI000215CDF0
MLVGDQLDRLDRSVAIPAVSADVLKTWADQQVTVLRQQDGLSLESSKILLNLGAVAEDIFIISHGNTPLTTRMFRELVFQLDELWLLDQDEISYNSDRDDVLKFEFEDLLELDSKVFLLNMRVLENRFITESVWPEQLFPGALLFPIEIANQVLKEVWGYGEQEEQDDAIIGTANGTSIVRTVTICRRNSNSR